ncbi:MAG: assimilatory sulfite reductase (NADPH) hemoprotein subunit [Proteobacteria bacterium]|nr:assimilatory sulfite reductase (NADPH) hemoprotein subunit [Pseudomonadota bacterium]
MSGDDTLTEVEGIKARSDYLRGTIVESLADSATGTLAEDDTQLSKFHGFYQQDDRDIRAERTRQKLEPAHSFMIRVRVPGGIATSAQWLQMDTLARQYANNTLRLTTRQAFQFHGVIKSDLKATIAAINNSLLDTIAACGDVNRNVMCTPLAEKSAIHAAAYKTATEISAHLTPNTRAYHEIWLDKKRVAGGEDSEPIYGATYLPRKFKIGIAIPPSNDVDIFSQDLGFIAIQKNGELAGFNVAVGGGMGMHHGEPETYPRVADVIGFCTPEQAVNLAEQVVKIQRDHGDRTNRKHARLKYTIDDNGLDWFQDELHRRLGFELQPKSPYLFVSRGDDFGWSVDQHGEWHLTLFVPQGRVADVGDRKMMSALAEIAKVHQGTFRLTANQNVIISGVPAKKKPQIENLLQSHGVKPAQKISPLRQQALACVAFPTCGLAMAEAERYLPDLLEQVESLLAKHSLIEEPISLRITGCPNGCARPYLAEIALVGKAPGQYSLFLGGDSNGTRLNTLTHENVNESQILDILDQWLTSFVEQRRANESFGDFIDRHNYSLAEIN